MRVIAVCAVLALAGFVRSQDQAGLVLGFSVGEGEAARADERLARTVALTVADGERPTPFLDAGQFLAEWRGELVLEKRDKIGFAFVGFGRFELMIDGEIWLACASATGEPVVGEVRRLGKGSHAFQASWAPAHGKPRCMRLEWEGRAFRREPIPSHVFRPAALDPKSV
ncbi:MAG: hypothetical protein KDB80_08465, partial [Planctomycetes bacterium]|nr:hypothetical protein [Planctomycetota bacterium]